MLVVEGSVDSGNLWVEVVNSLWVLDLEEGSGISWLSEGGDVGSWLGEGGGVGNWLGESSGVGNWLGEGLEGDSLDWEVSSVGVWLSSSWLSAVLWNGLWLVHDAWGSRLTVLWSIGSIAWGSLAVNSDWSIGSVADWEVTWLGLDDNWVPLVIVEFLSLHGDVLSEVLISVHSSGEEHVVWDAVNTSNSGMLAVSLSLGLELEESSGSWVFLSEWWGIKGWWSISECDSRDGSEKGSDSNGFHFFVY